MNQKNCGVLGLIASVVFLIHQSTSAGTISYQYDSLHRLTEISYPEGTIIQYSYDLAGNRTQTIISNSAVDSDGDGLTSQEEIDIYGTNPLRFDTDGDGLGDGAEVGIASYDDNPLTTTDPLNPDSDGDGYLDGNNGVDPCEDCDNSGSIEGEETDPLAPEAFVRLVEGWSLFSYPAEVPPEDASCVGLAAALGGFDAIKSISRRNSETGLFEHCDVNGGVDFPVVTGEAYVVRPLAEVSMVWPWSPNCPVRSLDVGVNLVGHPSPTDLTCHSWLEQQSPGTVSSIQRYDENAGRFETCTLVDLDETGPQAVGVDFPIRAARGYLFHAAALGSVLYPACP